MSLKTVEMFAVVCDECGASAFENDESVAWSDPDGALEVFRDSIGDWSESPDGSKHRCPAHNPFCEKCGKDAGELSGERDYMCPTCWVLADVVEEEGP